MTLEVGDLFIVTRGFKYGDTPSFAFSICGSSFGEPEKKEPSYDRSYYSCVFQAVAMCGPGVVAKCLSDNGMFSKAYSKVGQVFQFNLNEIEIWPVTQQYLDALTTETTP